MTDIVERLRGAGDRDEGLPYSTMHEAADAITWLRVEIEQQRKQWEDIWQRNVALLAEIERLCAITQMPLDDYVEQLRRRLEASEAALANVAGIMHRFKE